MLPKNVILGKESEENNSPTHWKWTFPLDWNFYDQLWCQKLKAWAVTNTLNCRKTSRKNARCYSRDYSECQFFHNFVLIFRNRKLYSFWCIKTKTNPNLPKFTFNSMSVTKYIWRTNRIQTTFLFDWAGSGHRIRSAELCFEPCAKFLSTKIFSQCVPWV